MKKIISLFLAVCMAVPFSLFSKHRSCECGTHATDIFTYTVTEGTGNCCAGTVLTNSIGFRKIYEWDGGAYVHIDDEPITASGAQGACCPNT